MTSKTVWVFVEQTNDVISEVSLEILGQATKIGVSYSETKVSAIILGENIKNASKLIHFGADKVFLCQDKRLKYYSNEVYSKIISTLAKTHKPDIFLIGSTAVGSELAPTIAAQLETGLAAHCVNLEINNEGNLAQVVPSFGGKVMCEIQCPDRRPQIATIKPGVFEKIVEDRDRKGEVVEVDVNSLVPYIRTKVTPIEMKKRISPSKSLDTSDVVVAGGWGIGDKEGWSVLEEFARLLGAALGCTRPVIDEGWQLEDHLMIGSSGKTIKPKVYIGVGISGSSHHICGMKDSGLIIGVNIDEHAPLFEISDIKIVQDFRLLIPFLMERISYFKSGKSQSRNESNPF